MLGRREVPAMTQVNDIQSLRKDLCPLNQVQFVWMGLQFLHVEFVGEDNKFNYFIFNIIQLWNYINICEIC